MLLICLSGDGVDRKFLYLSVSLGNDLLKFGSTLDSIQHHWNRISTTYSFRHVLLLWKVPSKFKLSGEHSVEACFLKMLKGDKHGVSKANEVLYRFDEDKNDMLSLYIKVIVLFFNCKLLYIIDFFLLGNKQILF
jgi:hypothetical protein